ncbi:MAG: hypothetical protein KC457_31565 [Myxococcales bacterium]|nr:hypothetical protein [Myxococcales bacterium]
MRWSPTDLSQLAAVALLAAALACDGGKAEDSNAKAEADAKAAADAKKAKEAEEAEALAKGLEERKKREDAEKAKYDAFAARFVKGRDKQPKDLDAACTELIEVYSDWVKAIYFDDDRYQLEFFDHKKENLGKVMGNCAKLDSIESTSCMVEVIKGVTAEDVSEEDRKMLQAKPDFLFDSCVAKFAPDKQ